MTFKELKKNSAARKAKEAQTVVDREGIDKQDFVQQSVSFQYFVLIPVVIMQYLYDSV